MAKTDESNRLKRIALILEKATMVLGSIDNAREWLSTPSSDFEDETPLKYAKTAKGAQTVESVLERIADGVIF